MRPTRQGTPVLVWFAVALVAGLAQVPLVWFYEKTATYERLLPLKKRKRVIRVSMRPQRRRAKKKRPKIVEPKVTGQIVTVRPPEREVRPNRRAKYLSEYNTRTRKEVKARPSRRKSRRAGLATKKRSKVQSKKSRSVKETATVKVQPKKQVELPQKPKKAAKSPDGQARPKTDLLRSERSVALSPTVDRRAALANVQAITGGTFSDDALMDVKEVGKETVLNSNKFRHWAFFDTVKQRVRKHWHPAKLYRRRDPTGKVYGIKDRLTVLKVTLDKAGKLQRLTTVKNSGVDFLDSEARRALRRAAPFVNPPMGLIDRHGAIVFQFGFLFEISSSRFKFFRIPM